MAQFERIMVLLENRSEIERNIALGVARYARKAGTNWHLINAPSIDSESLRRLTGWNACGAIGTARTLRASRTAASLPFPFVNVFTGRTFAAPPQVGPDHLALGRKAAEYLADLGFRHFIFLSIAPRNITDLRMQGFATALEERYLAVQKLCLPDDSMEDIEGSPLFNALRNSPRPTAACGTDDSAARRVIRACREARLAVPEDVAVLGIDNNALLCEGSYIPVSSVAWPAEQAGYEAAAVLHRLLQGYPPPEAPVLIKPTEVTTRQSTDVLAVDDPAVAKVLRIIRANAGRRIHIGEIVRSSGMCRRSLETRFREVMQRSLHAEIRRVQIELAKKALRETDLQMDGIADVSGFGNGIHLGLEFKKHTGMSPGAYRKQFSYDRVIRIGEAGR